MTCQNHEEICADEAQPASSVKGRTLLDIVPSQCWATTANIAQLKEFAGVKL